MLYILTPWLICFVPGSLYFLFFLTYFTHPSNTLSSGDCLFVLYIYVSIFFFCCCCYIYSLFKNISHITDINHTVFTFHWVISLHIKSPESIHVIPNGKMLFLLWLNNIHIYMWYIHTTSILSIHLSMDSYFDIVKLYIYIFKILYFIFILYLYIAYHNPMLYS